MTTATVCILRAWRPNLLEECAQTLAANRDRLAALGVLLQRGRPSAGAWEGEAAGSALTRHTELVGEHRQLVAGVAATARAVATAAEQAALVTRLLAHADDVASQWGMRVLDEGGVIDWSRAASPEDPVTAQVLAAARERARWEVRDYVEQALRAAKQLDATLVALLLAALRGEIVESIGAAVGPAALLAPPAVVASEDPTPWDNAAWWSSLTPTEQFRVIDEHPDWVGSRDGIPAWARDRANRVLLDASEQSLVAEEVRLRPTSLDDWVLLDTTVTVAAAAMAAVTAGPVAGLIAKTHVQERIPEPDSPRSRAHREVVAKLESVRAVKAVVAQPDGRERQLLRLDVSGRLAKAVITSGNVDRAGHVAVFSGGFTTSVNGDLRRYDRVMGRMTTLATGLSKAHGDGRAVAAVVWMGYEAPQWSNVLDPRRSVASWQPAHVGGAALAQFANGLDASRAQPAHLTLWGHSYGSTTSGLALRDHNTGVDDFAAFGSPGIGVDAVAALNLPPGHVHVLQAAGDIGADLEHFGGDPDRLPGAHRISAAEVRLPDGNTGLASHGHSEYLDLDTTSAWNLAAVAAGTPSVMVEERACARASVFWPPIPPSCPPN